MSAESIHVKRTGVGSEYLIKLPKAGIWMYLAPDAGPSGNEGRLSVLAHENKTEIHLDGDAVFRLFAKLADGHLRDEFQSLLDKAGAL